MLQLLSLHAATTEAHVPRAHAPQREANAMRSLCTATKRKPVHSCEDPTQQKEKKKKKLHAAA